MIITYNRYTVNNTVHIAGKGLHSGLPVQIQIRPGNDGIHFCFDNLRCEARPKNVVNTQLCTKLVNISTIEHLMSAFAGLEITDAEIALDAPELPALDGASENYVKSILEVGLKDLGQKSIDIPSELCNLKTSEFEIQVTAGSGIWNYSFESGDRWPGVQTASLEYTVENYMKQIAPARTFAFEEQIEHILQAGLARGLDENSALILGQSGYVNNAKFDNEAARHKLLDLIGDLYLAGIPIKFLDVQAKRSGHMSNVRAAIQVLSNIRTLETVG